MKKILYANGQRQENSIRQEHQITYTADLEVKKKQNTVQKQYKKSLKAKYL